MVLLDNYYLQSRKNENNGKKKMETQIIMILM